MMHRSGVLPSTYPLRAARLVVRCDVRVFITAKKGGAVITGRVVNISTGGVFIACCDPMLPGHEIALDIQHLQLDASPLKLNGRVVHVDANGMGVRFDAADPRVNDQVFQFILRLKSR